MKSKEPLTLDTIKNCIEFDKDSLIYKALISSVNCWYNIALGQGKSEQEALNETFDKLCEKMLSLSKPYENNQSYSGIDENTKDVKMCYDNIPCTGNCTLDNCPVTSKWQE